MNEDKTKEQPDARPFEERVLAAITEMRADFNARLEKLEAKSFDTKPIWERALAEIVEVSRKVDLMERHMKVMRDDIHNMRADGVGFEDRLSKLESM
ncbi:MAG: hypothetical protein M3458_20880 [Acidobacteriota bacterium]|nr:hypothetical protein [Acidobacteriota bacterium]